MRLGSCRPIRVGRRDRRSAWFHPARLSRYDRRSARSTDSPQGASHRCPCSSPIPPQGRRDFLRRALAVASVGVDRIRGSLALGQGDGDRTRGAAAANFLKHYVDGYLPLYKAATEAAWAASTDVSEAHTADQIARGQALNEFVGARNVIDGVKRHLASPATSSPTSTDPPAREGPP